MLGLGHLLSYLAGSLDLMKFFENALEKTQLKQICVIASAILIFCVTVTCYCVEERALVTGP
jgi:solute carrier family 45 protein 1/2/4